MNETIIDALEALTILEDLSTKNPLNHLAIECFVIAGIFLVFALLDLIFYITTEPKISVVICGIFIAMGIYCGTALLFFVKQNPIIIKYVILAEDIDHTQLHHYFKISDAEIDDEAVIEPKPEYYEEALEWYKSSSLAVRAEVV